jgi:DNA/RNA endonuclease G (NUC1)
MVFHPGYVLQHSSKDKIALWVCEAVGKSQLLGDLPRDDNFKPEPGLPVGQRAELADYRNSGYDTRHQWSVLTQDPVPAALLTRACGTCASKAVLAST